MTVWYVGAYAPTYQTVNKFGFIYKIELKRLLSNEDQSCLWETKETREILRSPCRRIVFYRWFPYQSVAVQLGQTLWFNV